MAELRDLVKQIRAVLSSGHKPDKDQVAKLARSYQRACERVKQRASVCRDLLNSRQRGRAADLAKQPPDLQASFNVLNFAERSTWSGLCEGLGVSAKSDLDVNAIGAVISDLYSQRENRDYLIKLHRRMALGQAPAQDRLQVLRRIYDADPNPKFWEDDLRAYESARIHELVTLAKRADEGADLAALEAILAELRGSDWVKKSPSSSFVRSVEERTLPHRHRLAQARYNDLYGRMREAHSSLNESRCRELFEEWLAVEQQTGVEPASDLVEPMAAVRAWLQELQRARDEEIDFQKACDALEKAIDDNEKLGGLEKLAAAALRFDRGMPDLLAARFGSRMQELKRVAKRRFALVLTGTVLSLALVAFGVTRILSWRGRVQERGRWQDQIAQALDAGDLERAGELLSHLEKRAPELLNSPEIKGLRARYEQGIGAEKVRRETFDGVMASLQKEWQGSPDPPSARRKLRRAEKLAAKYEEKTKVEDWRQTIQAHADAQDRKLENEHKRQLDELQTCYNELLDAQQKGEESVEIVARRCLAMAAALINAEDIPAPLKARALAIQDATRRTRKAIRDKIARRTATRKALGDIASAYKSPTTLAERLRSFTQDYPDHPLTPDFARSVRMEPHWRAVKEWARSTAHWGAHVEVHSSRTVGARLIRLKEYLKDHPGSAYQAAAAEYRQYLEKGKDVITEDELKGLTSVQNMLSGRIYAPNLYTVFTKSRERYYYFASKHAPFPSTGGVNYITDLRLRTRHTNIAPRQLIGKPEVAPHSAFAERALKLLRSFKGPGWATLYLRLAELARTQPDMDPILRARLLKISLRYAGGTIAWHAERVQKTIDQLDKFAPDFKLDVPWPDPKDHDANRFRPEIQNALYRIDSFKGLIREVEERIKELPNRLSRHHVVGVMLGDAGEVQLKSAAQTGDLYVLWADGQQAPTFNKIGTVKNGAPLIDKKAASRYPRGNPIFMRR